MACCNRCEHEELVGRVAGLFDDDLETAQGGAVATAVSEIPEFVFLEGHVDAPAPQAAPAQATPPSPGITSKLSLPIVLGVAAGLLFFMVKR